MIARMRGWVLLSFVALAACGPSSKRDAKTPANELTYDDACKLQDYFDERRANQMKPLKAEDEAILTTEGGKTFGEGNYRLSDAMARRRFARLLRDEYAGIDAKVIAAVESSDAPVVVHVRWWDAGTIRRLHPERDVVVRTSAGEVELPPNACVGDLLFGDEVYEKRAAYLHNEVDYETGKTTSAGSPATP